MKNKKLFQEYMAGLSELFDKKLSTLAIKMYWRALSSFTDEQCKIVFDKAVAKYKFFPKPAELIQDIETPKEYLAQQQAGYLVACLEGVGYRNPEGWDEDPTTKRLLEGRFRGIYERSLESDIKWIEKDFIQAYQDISDYVDNDEKLKIEAGPEVRKLVNGIGGK
jgi:hypothetical protein